MKKLDIGLSDVQNVYSGPEGTLWKLVMGEQIQYWRICRVNGIGPESRHQRRRQGT